jgi:hypothetical protein
MRLVDATLAQVCNKTSELIDAGPYPCAVTDAAAVETQGDDASQHTRTTALTAVIR